MLIFNILDLFHNFSLQTYKFFIFFKMLSQDIFVASSYKNRKVILIFLSARHNIIAKVLCQFKDSTSQPKTQQIKETDLDKHCRMRNFPFYLVQRSDIRGDANRWMPDPTFLYILPSGKITVAVVLAGTSTVNSNESASILQSERTGPYRD